MVLPTQAALISLILLIFGIEAFLFTVTVIVPSAAFAQNVGTALSVLGVWPGLSIMAPSMMAGAWITGFSLYMILQRRMPTGFRVPRNIPLSVAILLVAVVIAVICHSDVSPLMTIFSGIAVALLGPFMEPLTQSYFGLAAVIVPSILYSFVTTWLIKVIERARTSLLLAASISSIVALFLSMLTINLAVALVNQLVFTMRSSLYMVPAILLVVLAGMRDIREALMRLDPALLVQIPTIYIVIHALARALETAMPGITAVIPLLLLVAYMLVIVGASIGLGTGNRRLLCATAIISSTFSILPPTMIM